MRIQFAASLTYRSTAYFWVSVKYFGDVIPLVGEALCLQFKG